MKGAQTSPWGSSHPGSACAPSFQAPGCPDSLGSRPLGPEVSKQVPALQRLGRPPGLGASPARLQGLVYFPSVSASLFPPCPQEGML